MPLTFKNFTASSRKPFLRGFSLLLSGRDLSYIEGSQGTGRVSREVPSGTKNGVNRDFTLSIGKDEADVINILLNGLTLKESVGYTLSGVNLTMSLGYEPEASDPFEAEIFY